MITIKEVIRDYFMLDNTKRLAMLVILAAATSIILLGFGVLSKAHANTLICEFNVSGETKFIVYATAKNAEGPDDIKEVMTRDAGYSTVKYGDGRVIYIAVNSTACHQINGNSDKAEEALVDDLLNQLQPKED